MLFLSQTSFYRVMTHSSYHKDSGKITLPVPLLSCFHPVIIPVSGQQVWMPPDRNSLPQHSYPDYLVTRSASGQKGSDHYNSPRANGHIQKSNLPEVVFPNNLGANSSAVIPFPFASKVTTRSFPSFFVLSTLQPLP